MQFLLWLWLLFWGVPAFAQGSVTPYFPLAPGLTIPGQGPSYLTTNRENKILNGARLLNVLPPLRGFDEGNPGLTYNLGLDIVPIKLGGTGASNNQTAIDNLFGGNDGDILVKVGGHWTNLPKGIEGQSLTITNNIPAWTNANVSISKDEQVLTFQKSLLPHARQVTGGDGITADDSNGQLAFRVDSTVARTNIAETFEQTVNFSVAPVIGGANWLGLKFQTSNGALSVAVDPMPFDYRVTIPSPGTNAKFVLTEGTQNINAQTTFQDLRIGNDSLLTPNGKQSFPHGDDTLVNCTAPQALTNKEFVGITLDNAAPGMVLKTIGGQYIIDWQPLASSLHYHFIDAGSDGDIAIQNGKPVKGSIAYGNGNTISFSNPGLPGQPLLSTGSACTFDVLGSDWGGTGYQSYSPGDILVADTTGRLRKLPMGKPGTHLTVSADGKEILWQ